MDEPLILLTVDSRCSYSVQMFAKRTEIHRQPQLSAPTQLHRATSTTTHQLRRWRSNSEPAGYLASRPCTKRSAHLAAVPLPAAPESLSRTGDECFPYPRRTVTERQSPQHTGRSS